MQEHVEEKVHFYDDFSPFEEESMPETIPHAELVEYLVAVLKWLFRGHVCAVCKNLAFFATPELHAPPVAPDIAVIKGVPLQPVNSWRVGRTGPAPQVVFEILSAETWKKDVEEKPLAYARMGIQEYFASMTGTIRCGLPKLKLVLGKPRPKLKPGGLQRGRPEPKQRPGEPQRSRPRSYLRNCAH
jgi:hypothetical protein